jgi:hypothetical protein
VLNHKHLGWSAVRNAARIAIGHLAQGQTNFIKMMWKFDRVYNPELQLFDHRQPVTYEMALPPEPELKPDPSKLFIHSPGGRRGRAIDNATEAFVDATRMGADARSG